MAIGRTNAIALAGKQTASGTFTATGTTTQNITVGFTANYVMCVLRSSSQNFNGYSKLRSIVYDFANGYGFSCGSQYFMSADTVIAENLKYSGNSGQVPTQSSGVVTLKGIGMLSFESGDVYEWFASE